MSAAHAHRPNRDKNNKSHTTTDHTVTSTDAQGSTVKHQVTAEQMRLAQMITSESNKGEDPIVKEKITKVRELTGRSEDDCLFALYDANYDLDRAVEKLLESETQTEWHSISKKTKKTQPAVAKVEPIVNNTPKSDSKREKSKDRDVEKPERTESRSRRDRGPPRFQRGRGRDRGGGEEGDRLRGGDQSGDRNNDRGERGGRGRGRGGGAGRGRGRGRGSTSSNSRGTRFDQNKEKGPHIDTWTNEQAKAPEKDNIGSWDEMTEDWTADDWQGSLDESKVFTPSTATEQSMFSSSVNDNDAKMFTPPPAIETQVFTASSLAANTSVSPTLNNSTGTFQHNGSPLRQQNTHSQVPIGHSAIGQSAISQNSIGPNSLGQRLDLDTFFPKSPETTSSIAQQQQQYLTQYKKAAAESIKNAVGIGSPAAGQQASIGTVPPSGDSSRNLTAPGQPTSQQRPKTQRSKLPPPSKIPASAVEMPGGMNFQLDVQFGNLDFGNSVNDNNTAGLGFGSPINSSAGTAPNTYQSPQISVAPTKPQGSTGISTLDSLSQSSSQSPRASSGPFPPSSSATPPKDYSQATLAQTAAMSSPDSIQYPSSQDRKASPYSAQRGNQGSGSISSNKPTTSPMAYNQSSYSSGYQSSSYKPVHTTSASSYSHQTNGLTSGGLSHQSGLSGQSPYSSASGYQTSSFPSQSGYSSQTQSSLYQNSSNQNSYSPEVSSYSSGPASSYQSQSGSYPSQSSGGYAGQSYSNRDSRDSNHGGQSSSRGFQSSSGVSQSASPYQASVTQSTTPVTSAVYQRDSQSATAYNHQTYGSPSQNSHQSSLASSKLSDSIGKMSMKDTTGLDSQSSQFTDHSSSGLSSASLTTTTSTTSSSLASGSVNTSTSLGLSNTIPNSLTATTATSKSSSAVNTKPPPNLPPGVPLIQNYMAIGQPGMAPFPFPGLAAAGQQPYYNFEELQLQLAQQRIPVPGHSYDLPLQPTTTLSTRDQNPAMASAPYSTSGADSKLTRMDAQSPVNAQTTQAQTAGHQQQQTFISPTALPPGYNYYYPSGVLPGGYSYPPTMFPVPSVTNAAHGGSTASVQFQKPGGYGSHAYGTAGQNQDFSKGYSGVSASQNKLSSGTMATVSSTSDLTGTGSGSYGKTHTQSFDKAGFHGGTPPPFNLPLPSGTQAGPMGPQTAYGAQYVPVMTHQPHSQMLHHPLQQDSTGSSARNSQQSSSQNKQAINKNYSTYWGAN